MVSNPYESPRELGYGRPTQRSRWWDFIACIATALLISCGISSCGSNLSILGLDWTSPFRPCARLSSQSGTVFVAFFASLFLPGDGRGASKSASYDSIFTPDPMQYRLRTLLILMAIGPPMLAWSWFGWLDYREHQRPRFPDDDHHTGTRNPGRGRARPWASTFTDP